MSATPATGTNPPPASSRLPREGQTHLRGFLDYLQAECGLSLNTRMAYQRDLRGFLACAARDGVGDLSRLTVGHVEGFLRAARERGLSPSSVARALAAVSMFCRYLVIQRVLASDVSDSIEPPKKWHRLPVILNERSISDLLDAPDPARNRYALRDRAILAMLYATGMRAAEIAGLKLTDVNHNLGIVRVLGKGSKERIVPVAAAALETVTRYVADAREDPTSPAAAECVFLTKSGGKLRREDIFRIVRGYVRQAAIRGNVSPHTLRHCFATQMLSHGADLRSVQEMLGHADIATTQIYTHVDPSRLRAIHKKFHPRG